MEDSVIPYNDYPSDIVLRHENSLVVYDQTSHQLALRQAEPLVRTRSASELTPPACPYCNRPFNEDAGLHGSEEGDVGSVPAQEVQEGTRGFINPEYFQMLGSSLVQEHAHTPSPPTSPHKLIRRPTIEDGESEKLPGSPRRRPSSSHGISSSAFTPKYFEKFFMVERELGRGGKGVVLLVTHMLDGVPLGQFACKRVPVGDDHEWLRKVLMEVQLLQQLSHQNLVSYRHVWLEDVVLTNFGPSVPCAFILQQYCNAGDLHKYVYSSDSGKGKSTKEQLKERMRRMSKGQPVPANIGHGPRRLTFEQIISFFRDIASGLNHLHSNGFIHRDLKPSNCLLSDTGIPGAELRVLVSDFGEVQVANVARKSSGATGTISYCAPEVLQRVGPNGEFANFTTKSDIFSLGMILYFMCFGRLPYLSSDQENEEGVNEDLISLRAEISAWTGFEDKYREARQDLPDKLYTSLKHLLSTDPNKRPSAADILVGISTEFGSFAEESSPMHKRGHLSPKIQTTDVEDDNRFFRIQPVSDSSPVTPNISPAPSFIRGSSGRPSPLKHSHHARPQSSQRQRTPPSKLREFERFPPNKRQRPDDPAPASDRPTSSSSMILRPRKESKQLQDLDRPRTLSPALLTLSHPTITYQRRLLNILSRPESWLLVKLVIFFGKAISIANPCLPMAPNPWVYYPLLMLALLDFVGPFLMTTAVLGGLHVGLLLIVQRVGWVCAVRASF